MKNIFLNKIIEDITFILDHTENVSFEEFSNNELLNNAIGFRFIQLSENSKQISKEMIEKHPEIPWHKINALRNKIVHDYGEIKLDIIYDTIKNDLPDLLINIENISF